MQRPNRTLLFIYLAALLASCTGSSPSTEDDDPGDSVLVGSELEQQRNARLASKTSITIGAGKVLDLGLHPAQVAADIVLHDCGRMLGRAPGGAVFGSGSVAGGDFVANCPVTSVVSAGNLDGTPSFNLDAASLDCNKAMCKAQVSLCVSHRLLELASSVAPTAYSSTLLGESDLVAKAGNPTERLWSDQAGAPLVSISIPPPDAESAAAFRELAFFYAAYASTMAGENLRAGAGTTAAAYGKCSGAMNNTYQAAGNGLTALTFGEAFAAVLGESILIGEEAGIEAVDSTVAVAQTEASSVSDPRLSSSLTWTHGSMSRARASHLLVGGGMGQGMAGYNGTSGNTALDLKDIQPFCAGYELNGSEQRALELLRLVAPHPNFFTGKPLSKLSDAWTSPVSPDAHSLRQRFSEHFGEANIPASFALFLQEHGLSENDFNAARQHVGSQIAAHARDKTAVLPALELGKDAAGNVRKTVAPRYAAVASEPSELPGPFYQSLVRFTRFDDDKTDDAAASGVDAVGLPTLTGRAYPLRSLSAQLDYLRFVAYDLLPQTGQTTTLPVSVQNALSSHLGAFGGKVTGRLETCARRYNTSTHELRVRVYANDLGATGQTNDYLIVAGPSGLRCAVEGHIEGAPCNLASYKIGPTGVGGSMTAGYPAIADAPGSTFLKAVTFRLTQPPVNTDDPAANTLFVVRKKTPGAADEAGAYRALGSFRLQSGYPQTTSQTGWQRCALQPLVPALQLKVAAVLTPTGENCGRAAQTCAGGSTADRIPLDNELTDDGDPIESSWRTYLGRALEAADRAGHVDGRECRGRGRGPVQPVRCAGQPERVLPRQHQPVRRRLVHHRGRRLRQHQRADEVSQRPLRGGSDRRHQGARQGRRSQRGQDRRLPGRQADRCLAGQRRRVYLARQGHRQGLPGRERHAVPLRRGHQGRRRPMDLPLPDGALRRRHAHQPLVRPGHRPDRPARPVRQARRGRPADRSGHPARLQPPARDPQAGRGQAAP
jgi:hypothetical protein